MGGGGSSVTYVYISHDKLKQAVAYCLDDSNCTGAVSGAQQNSYIGEGKPDCGYLDKTARKLIKHAGCESFENKNTNQNSFTSYIENLQEKEKEIENIEIDNNIRNKKRQKTKHKT